MARQEPQKEWQARRDAPAWRDTLARLGYEPELAALAQTFAAIPPALAPEDRQALGLLALLILLASQDGHTRLPLTGAGGEETQARLAQFAGTGITLAALLDRPGLAPALAPALVPALAPALAPTLTSAPLGGSGDFSRPLVRTPDWLSSARLVSAETRLSAAARILLSRGPGGCFHQDLPLPDIQALLDQPIGLSGEQQQAVRRAVAGPFTLLTGGPGTGKTSIVVAILRAALRAGLDPSEVALAAPTGKAAQRMGESIRATLGRLPHPGANPEKGPGEGPDETDRNLQANLPEPQTLHRLLAFLPSRRAFRHHRNNPLPHRLVVVDESSMIGLELMDGLVGALGPQARLVLLGDAEQLPSVEPGAVFRDLVEALPDATVRLTHSYRMDAANPAGRSVLLTAQAMRRGDAAALDAAEALSARASWPEIRGFGAEHAEVDDPALKAFLAAYQEAEILGRPGFLEASERTYRHDGESWAEGDEPALKCLFQAHEHARLLCPLRETPSLRSVAGLNLALHRLMGREARGLDRDLAVYAGEPVMATLNDYRHNLFNGDQGIVVKARLEDGVHQAVAFRTQDGYRLLPYRSIQAQLDLAWAMTVHKAQGSEFDRVVLVLPPADSPLLTREILYTALTRARTSATILGSREALEAGLHRATLRYTGLALPQAPHHV